MTSSFAIGSFAYSLNTPSKADSSSFTYELVNDINYLRDGDEIIFVAINNSNYYAMGYQKDNNRHAVDIEDENPTRDGYKFVGWSITGESNNLFDFNTTVTEEFTLIAVWTEHSTSITDLSETKNKLSLSYYTELIKQEQNKTTVINPKLLYGFDKFTENSTFITQITPDIGSFINLTYNKNNNTNSTIDNKKIRLYPYNGNGTSLDFTITDTTNFKFDSIKVKFKMYNMNENSEGFAGLTINGKSFVGTKESQIVEFSSLSLVTNLKIQNTYNQTSYAIIDIEQITLTYNVTNYTKYYFTEVNLRTLVYIPNDLELLNNLSEFGFKVKANNKDLNIELI